MTFLLVDTTKFHFHTKYIDICYNFICQLAILNKFSFDYNFTSRMQANTFTKLFSNPKLGNHLFLLNVLEREPNLCHSLLTRAHLKSQIDNIFNQLVVSENEYEKNTFY